MYQEIVPAVPYQMPDTNALARRIQILEAERVERTRGMERLAALEEEADVLRVNLGLSPRTLRRSCDVRVRHDYERAEQEENSAREQCLILLDSPFLQDDMPALIRRERYADLDSAASYTAKKALALQRADNLLFVEKTCQSDATWLSDTQEQWAVGRDLQRPLFVNRKPRVGVRGFDVKNAVLGSWSLCKHALEKVIAEVETEKLIETAHDLVAQEACITVCHPLVRQQRQIGQEDGEHYDITARYYIKEGWLSLAGIAITLLHGETQVHRSTLDAREGTFDSWIENAPWTENLKAAVSAKQRFSQALDNVKTLLNQNEENL